MKHIMVEYIRYSDIVDVGLFLNPFFKKIGGLIL